jgi:hypothetical protein
MTLGSVTGPPQPPQRVSSVSLPDGYEPPAKPEGAPQQALDAYRQTAFLLGADLALFAQGMDLQLRILHDSSQSSFRKHPYGALVGLWSRTFQALSDACLLATRGGYGSSAPLIRSACECIAAQQQLNVAEMDEFVGWLASSYHPNDLHKAIEVPLGRYFAGETLAADERPAPRVPSGKRAWPAELRRHRPARRAGVE